MTAAELIVRTVGATLLPLLAIFLFHVRRPGTHTTQLGAALCISVAAFLITSAPGAQDWLGVFLYPLTAVCSTHPVWFWLFCASLFQDRFTFDLRHLAIVMAMGGFGASHQAMLPAAAAGNGEQLIAALGVLFGGMSLSFAALGPFAAWAGDAHDLDETRRRLRRRCVPLLSAYLAIVIVSQMGVLLSGRPTPGPLVLANIVFIDMLAALGLMTFLRVSFVSTLAPARALRVVEEPSRLEAGLLETLERRFEAERLYAREGLTISELARVLGTQEHLLRRAINQRLGFRNFNEFLHAYRLKEITQRLSDPRERRLPILTIALEAGYGSIGPFNRAFKARFGLIPKAYRDRDTELASPIPESARVSL